MDPLVHEECDESPTWAWTVRTPGTIRSTKAFLHFVWKQNIQIKIFQKRKSATGTCWNTRPGVIFWLAIANHAETSRAFVLERRDHTKIPERKSKIQRKTFHLIHVRTTWWVPSTLSSSFNCTQTSSVCDWCIICVNISLGNCFAVRRDGWLCWPSLQTGAPTTRPVPRSSILQNKLCVSCWWDKWKVLMSTCLFCHQCKLDGMEAEQSQLHVPLANTMFSHTQQKTTLQQMNTWNRVGSISAGVGTWIGSAVQCVPRPQQLDCKV